MGPFVEFYRRAERADIGKEMMKVYRPNEKQDPMNV